MNGWDPQWRGTTGQQEIPVNKLSWNTKNEGLAHDSGVSGWNTVFASWTLITIPWKIQVWRSWTPLGYAFFLIWCHLSLCLFAVFCCKAVALEASNHLGLILLDTIVQASNLLRPNRGSMTWNPCVLELTGTMILPSINSNRPRAAAAMFVEIVL